MLLLFCVLYFIIRNLSPNLNFRIKYYFPEAERTILECLTAEQFTQFRRLLEQKAEEIKHDDYAMQDILTFLLGIARKKEHDEEKFKELAMKFAPILGYGDLKQFLEDYEDENQ